MKVSPDLPYGVVLESTTSPPDILSGHLICSKQVSKHVPVSSTVRYCRLVLGSWGLLLVCRVPAGDKVTQPEVVRQVSSSLRLQAAAFRFKTYSTLQNGACRAANNARPPRTAQLRDHVGHSIPAGVGVWQRFWRARIYMPPCSGVNAGSRVFWSRVTHTPGKMPAEYGMRKRYVE